MRTVFIYVDDSGVLHEHAKNRYFIYAGYVFLDKKTKNDARRKYIALNKEIKKANEKYLELEELKASKIDRKHKYSLFKVLKNYESLSISVDIESIYDGILSNSRSIIRYKDFAMKKMIKEKFKILISEGKIDPDEDIELIIHIDNQNIATNGYYNLRESIIEEFKYGIYNYDYGKLHKNIINGNMNVCVEYCDSKTETLIQAADILANRIFTAYNKGDESLMNIPNHCHIILP